MRLATFRQRDKVSWGAVIGDEVVVSDTLGPSLRLALPDISMIAAAVEAAPRRIPIAEVELLPPIPDPPRILCVNFEPPRWLKPGDRVRVRVSAVGDLENPVVDEGEL